VSGTSTIEIPAVVVDGDSLTLENVRAVASQRARVELNGESLERLKESRQRVETVIAEGRVVYGLTTGFGKFKDVYVPPEEARALQRNFLLSHAAGVGKPFDAETLRALILLRANALAKGYSGIRPVVVKLLLDLLNAGVYPVVPEQGSVGASGDLAPLAHLSLVLIGEGEAVYEGQTMSGLEALQKAKLAPVQLEAKEGLALTNGTQAMTAIGVLTLLEAFRLAKFADIIGAMSLEALLGSERAFAAEVQSIRPHPGQKDSARNLRTLLQGSQLILSHANCAQVQDAYSLRCMPQVHGASRQAFEHAKEVLEIEINSATDNPLVFNDNIISAGNFHGQPVAVVMDYVAVALAELANISERRTERLVNPALSNGLPPFLTARGGLHSGLMMAQYTAAALVSENKSLAHPASVDSIPTSANQEDHVSMGTIAARKARMILENVRKVFAIELLCAAQALDFRTGKALHSEGEWLMPGVPPGKGVVAAYGQFRSHISHMDADRAIYLDIREAEDLLRGEELLSAVEKAVGPLA
jgi:histidine ammonia-lyase